MGCDRACAGVRRVSWDFNPRTRVGCDVDDKNIYQLLPLFQSTHPRGVRPRFSFRNRGPRTFQSTHPRGVRHPVRHTRIVRRQFQSTHPRGVRQLSETICPVVDGFQSTHPRGVRPRYRLKLHFFRRFQSTHPRGVRPAQSQVKGGCKNDFNPRTRVGCDLSDSVVLLDECHFNPRTRVGCDYRKRNREKQDGNFNPRTRVGCDAFYNGPVKAAMISIHAPAWGATFSNFASFTISSFQSTHPRGVRRKSGEAFKTSAINFNPRTRVGCDTKKCNACGITKIFQSTHPRGVRLREQIFNVVLCKFQSTHPRGVRRSAILT